MTGSKVVKENEATTGEVDNEDHAQVTDNESAETVVIEASQTV